MFDECCIHETTRVIEEPDNMPRVITHCMKTNKPCNEKECLLFSELFCGDAEASFKYPICEE